MVWRIFGAAGRIQKRTEGIRRRVGARIRVRHVIIGVGRLFRDRHQR